MVSAWRKKGRGTLSYAYRISAFLRKRDARERLFVMEDGTRIPLDEVRDVEGDAFFDMENV